MTQADLNLFRQHLLDLRGRLTGDVTHLEDEALGSNGGEGGNLSHTPIHMADLGTDNFEQEFSLSLLESKQQILEEIGGALERLTQGQFGRCEECQKEVPRPRLQALPYTRHCVDCARKLEQSEE